jgi:hypothetical protein
MAQRGHYTSAMKDRLHTETICRDFCIYFKEGKKEEFRCGGYTYLSEHLTVNELACLCNTIPEKDIIKKNIPTDNKELFQLVCNKCEFLIDGCDYRDGCAAPPCGGYLLIDRLIR